MKKGLLKLAAVGCLLTSTQAFSHDIYGLDIELGKVSMTTSFNQRLVHDGGTTFGFGDYELQGYGVVSKLNNLLDNNFNFAPFNCTDVLGPGSTSCLLMYNFGGFMLNDAISTTDSGFNALDLKFGAENSYINFYLVDTTEFTASVISGIGSAGYNQSVFDTLQNLQGGSQQYLDLTADAPVYTGTQFLPGQPGLSNAATEARGGFEVQSHIGAGWYHDLPDNTLSPDVSFNSGIAGDSFSSGNIGTDPDDGLIKFDIAALEGKISRDAFGTAGFTTQVPEPSTLAMFSVALLGFGAAARKRRQA